MVVNILDFSRMESGRKTWDFADTDVAGIVRSALEEFEPMLVEQGFDVDVAIPDGPLIVRADPEALETAVANLLDVADRGVGIPAGESSLIFEKYQRASNAAATATGTGPVLALVAGIAQSHSGTVQVLPREGGGSLFRFTLPTHR
jgi:signal transduction histidine kinase